MLQAFSASGWAPPAEPPDLPRENPENKWVRLPEPVMAWRYVGVDEAPQLIRGYRWGYYGRYDKKIILLYIGRFDTILLLHLNICYLI